MNQELSFKVCDTRRPRACLLCPSVRHTCGYRSERATKNYIWSHVRFQEFLRLKGPEQKPFLMFLHLSVDQACRQRFHFQILIHSKQITFLTDSILFHQLIEEPKLDEKKMKNCNSFMTKK